MISRLTGVLAHKAPDHCVIDVNGVGYCVNTSLTTFSGLPEMNDRVSLAIHTHVREDQLQLFGFSTPEEKALFQRLISISGVGPKMAIALLSGMPTIKLIEAIANGDCARLSTIPGIGRKTADRIVIELRDRIARDLGKFSTHVSSAASNLLEDAISALVNLGYKRQVAECTLRKSGVTDAMRIEDVIRSALQELNRL